MERLIEAAHSVNGLAPSADVYAGGVATDVVSMKNYRRARFTLFQVTGGTNTGVGTITIEACDDVVPTNTTAIPFKMVRNESAGTADTMGAEESIAATGVDTTANKTAIYQVEVKAEDLPAGKPFVRMKIAEKVNDPVIGAVLIDVYEPRFGPAAPEKLTSAIA